MYYLLDKVSQVVLFIGIVLIFMSCNPEKQINKVGVLSQKVELEDEIIVGAQNIAEYLPLIKGKRVGMIVNQTSKVDGEHIVDTLLKYDIDLKTIFAPEHGFRGDADAGEKVKNSVDPKTGIPVISLYGNNKKPVKKDLKDIEVLVFDIQDVGVRFYTYISTLTYIMEACAENGIQLIVLDRPNPNAHYVDGPILEPAFSSFVGMHPVPVVYGMTIGEYAQMVNGEEWLLNKVKADLTVIHCRNYSHNSYYNLPVKPSPNLPNIQSIFLYPSLCFFEGTQVSVGRGTTDQFQIYGHPKMNGDYSFTPVSKPGAKYPRHLNTKCNGYSLKSLTKGSLHEAGHLDLSYLIGAYQDLHQKGNPFFLESNFFEKLSGTDKLRKQITNGSSEEQIRESWKDDIDHFMNVRAQYLLYD